VRVLNVGACIGEVLAGGVERGSKKPSPSSKCELPRNSDVELAVDVSGPWRSLKLSCDIRRAQPDETFDNVLDMPPRVGPPLDEIDRDHAVVPLPYACRGSCCCCCCHPPRRIVTEGCVVSSVTGCPSKSV
jgi:hypothetical protein